MKHTYRSGCAQLKTPFFLMICLSLALPVSRSAATVFDTLALLLEAGADYSAVDHQGKTVLMHYASEQGEQMFSYGGPSASAADKQEQSNVGRCAKTLEVIKSVAGDDSLADLINQRDAQGKTLLDYCKQKSPREEADFRKLMEDYGFDDSQAASVLTKSAAKV